MAWTFLQRPIFVFVGRFEYPNQLLLAVPGPWPAQCLRLGDVQKLGWVPTLVKEWFI